MKQPNIKRNREQPADEPQPHAQAWFEPRLVALVVTVKLSLLLFGVQCYQVLSNQPTAGLRGRLEIWHRWDALHYADIARLGYTSVGEKNVLLVFFPLYPWLVRAFALVSGEYLLSAFVVSGLASVAVALLLKQLVQLDFASDIADAAVVFLLIFPTSYFLHIGYTESLFLAFTLGCFLAARTDRWALACVLAALAGLTRINGLFLIPALLAEAYQQYRTTRRWQRQWLWIGIAPLGFGGYLLLNQYVTNSAFAFLTVQNAHWFRSLVFPWVGLRNTFNTMMTGTPVNAQMGGVLELSFAVLGLVCTLITWRRLRLSYGVWMTCNWLVFVSTPFVLSVPRYMLILFPIYILFADLARRHVLANTMLTTWSLLLLAFLVSQFVQGRWAF